MTTLLTWFNSPDWMIVVKTLLHTLWQAGGLALLLWLALRRVTTSATRYRLTLGTLAAILGTTLLTWAVLNQSATKSTAPDFASPTTPARKSSDISPNANFGEPSVIAYSTPIPKPAEETRWSGWLALAWMLGATLMLTRAGIQVAGAERLRRSCKPLDDSHITQLLAEAQCALNLTRRIRVAVTDKLTSPAVVGVIVPTLILPLTLLTTLTPEQIRFILLHELAHIRRGDYFANLFQLFIEALLFFNPAVWWISHQVRREREACCDALAIELSGAPVDYARTLLHVAETVLNPPPAAAPAFSDNQREPSSLTDRVQRLLVPGYRPALRLTWRAILAAIVVGGTLLFLSAVGARSTVGAVMSPKQSASENNLRTTITNAADTTETLTNASLLMFNGKRLTAAIILVNRTNGDFHAKGNVQWETTNGPMAADEFFGNTKTNIRSGGEAFWYFLWDTTNSISVNSSSNEATKRAGILTEAQFRNVLRTIEQRSGVALDSKAEIKFSGDRHPQVQMPWIKNGLAGIKNPDSYPAGLPDWEIGTQRTQISNQWFYYRVKPSNAVTTSPSIHGDPLIFRMFQYDDDSQAELDDVHKPAADLINLSNHRSLPDPDIKLRSVRKRIREPLVFTTGNYGNDGTNTQPFQPLESRVFTLDLNKYAATIRKFAGMPESTPLSNTYPLFRMFLTNAGVNLDPALGKTFFLSDSRGELNIHATKDELDAIESFLQPLAGVPLTHRTIHISPETLAKAANTLPPKISTLLATNTVGGLQALLESFDPSDPRPKRIQYKPETGEITARATEVDLNKFEAALNAMGQEHIQLVNRSFHTDANMMAQALGIIPKVIGSGGLQTNELVFTQPILAATNATQIRYAVSNAFIAVGVDLNPAQGKTFFYNDREGTILVRTTDKELDLIEAYIAKNTIPPPQVNIKTRWVEIPQKLMTPAWLNAASNAFFLPLADPETRYNILTEQEMADVRRRIERRDGIELLSEGQVTTLTERQAQISVSEVKTVVTGFSTNKNGAVEPEAKPVPLGPILDVLPTVTSDGASIRLEVIPTFTEFVGYDTNTATQFVPTVVNGETNSAMLPLPIFRVKQATHSAVVPDGQTLILGNFTVTEIAKQPNGEMRTTDVTSTHTNHLFILITPTIIDPAGNRAKPAPILNR